ncbi:FecR family protein [Uliginosibacterium sp. H1]|uniref:FecR family protein n=1 Tax=Uliginosibacterium sp. H1 TaxID=3114757 RepID=UPI002E181271|nr:FecR domain-containing protein [Uliginosibacterium sp. H1]
MSGHPPASRHDDDIAQCAADWIVHLSSDDPAERDAARAGFEAWKRADPRHAAAAAGMERFVDQARSLRRNAPADPAEADASAARAALDTVLDAGARRSRELARTRRITGLLGFLVVLVAAAALTLHAVPPAALLSGLLADARTATGEQRSQVLADGTRLTLGSASAVDFSFSPGLRQVTLLKGEILVQVASDPSRPFVVDTADGRIRALGTRFIVRREAGWTRLTMLESRTAASASGGDPSGITVTAGQQARLSASGVELLDAINPGLTEDAFLRQRLLVQGRTLPEVLDELARHRSGLIRYDRAQIEGIRVSAVLPLDDTDRALQLLVTSFPQLRVRSLTPWLVLVDSTE